MKRMITSSIDHIGEEVTIKVGRYFGEWGIVQYFDGEYYYVGLWGDKDSSLIFERNELKFK